MIFNLKKYKIATLIALFYLGNSCNSKKSETEVTISESKKIEKVSPARLKDLNKGLPSRDINIENEYTKIEKIYLDPSERFLLFNHDSIVGDTLIPCPIDSVVSILEESSKKHWVILNYLPKEAGPGRVADENKLFYVPSKAFVPWEKYHFYLLGFEMIEGEEYLFNDNEKKIKLSDLKQSLNK